MSVTVELNIKDFVRDIENLDFFNNASVSFGLHDVDSVGKIKETPEGPSNKTLKEVASIHEFGSGNIPQRSFIRSTYDENMNKYISLIRKISNASLSLKSKTVLKDGLKKIGDIGVNDIIDKINSRIPPPLSTETLRNKRQHRGISVSTPLIWSGQLKDSLKPKVSVS